MEIPFFDRLVHLMKALPGVSITEAVPPDRPLAEGSLRLSMPPEIAANFAEWSGALGDLAGAVPQAGGWLLIGGDGTAVVTSFVVTPAADTDPGRAAARFWADLYRAMGAVGRAEPFSAHGHLEVCRTALLGLYRLALAPGRPGSGWAGAEELPGGQVLGSLLDWLVCPLDLHAQWRCAHRLAAAYESLMLPLSQRLEMPYPWALRNLAFARLDAVRPAQPAAERMQAPPEPAEDGARAGPARFKVKLRRRSD